MFAVVPTERVAVSGPELPPSLLPPQAGPRVAVAGPGLSHARVAKPRPLDSGTVSVGGTVRQDEAAPGRRQPLGAAARRRGAARLLVAGRRRPERMRARLPALERAGVAAGAVARRASAWRRRVRGQGGACAAAASGNAIGRRARPAQRRCAGVGPGLAAAGATLPAAHSPAAARLR